MSARHTFWAWETPTSGMTKLILLSLADGADKDSGLCWYKQATIAAHCGVSVETVRRSLRELEGLGLLETIPQQREDGSVGPNKYRLTPCQADGCTPQRVGGYPTESGGVPHGETGLVVPSSVDPPSAAPERKEGSAPTRSKQEPLPDIPPELDTPAFREAWSLRLAERKEKGYKGKLHPTMVLSQFKELLKLAKARGVAAAVAAVERSTSGGYQGVVFKEDFANKEIGGKRPIPGIPTVELAVSAWPTHGYTNLLNPGWCYVSDPTSPSGVTTRRLDELEPGDVPLDDDLKEMAR